MTAIMSAPVQRQIERMHVQKVVRLFTASEPQTTATYAHTNQQTEHTVAARSTRHPNTDMMGMRVTATAYLKGISKCDR